jgi:hypothetical protein
VIIDGYTMENIVEEQFYLSHLSNINIVESSMLPLFEFEAYVNLAAKTLKK